MVSRITKIKEGSKKSKSPEIQDVTIELLEEELRQRSTPLVAEEIEFYKTYGTSQMTLSQFLHIQTADLDIGFFNDPPIDTELVNARNENSNNLFSTDFFNKIEKTQLSSLDYKTFHSYFSFSNPVEFAFSEEKVKNASENENGEKFETILSDNAITYPYSEKSLRSGIIYNTGGFPLCVEWLPFTFNEKKYLFMITVDNADYDLTSNISEFSSKPCCLTILEHTNDSFEVNKKIVIDYTVKEMEFSMLTTKDNQILLRLTLSNGTVEIWKIDEQFLMFNNNTNKYYRAISHPVVIKAPDNLIKITTSIFVTPNTVVFGTNHGFVGQFTIDQNKIDYIISTKLPSITCIKSIIPTSEDADSINVLVSTTDFVDYMINMPMPGRKQPLLNCLRIIKASIMRGELTFDRSCISLSHLKTFLSIEWPYSIKSYTVNNPKESPKFKVSIDREITCLSNNKSFNDGVTNGGHTLITGHTNGVIRLYNYIEMSRITDSKLYPYSLQLFQMKQSKVNENRFWLDLSYSADKNGEVSMKDKLKKDKDASKQNIVYPHGICPIKIAMLDRSIASIWGNGLLVIEDLIL